MAPNLLFHLSKQTVNYKQLLPCNLSCEISWLPAQRRRVENQEVVNVAIHRVNEELAEPGNADLHDPVAVLVAWPVPRVDDPPAPRAIIGQVGGGAPLRRNALGPAVAGPPPFLRGEGR